MKDKSKTMSNDTAVKKSFYKKSDFSKCVKLGRIRFWIGIKMESKIRISIKTMLIHNADHITRQNNTLKVTLIDNVRF
jgi:hypothetical protein